MLLSPPPLPPPVHSGWCEFLSSSGTVLVRIDVTYSGEGETFSISLAGRWPRNMGLGERDPEDATFTREKDGLEVEVHRYDASLSCV